MSKVKFKDKYCQWEMPSTSFDKMVDEKQLEVLLGHRKKKKWYRWLGDFLKFFVWAKIKSFLISLLN